MAYRYIQARQVEAVKKVCTWPRKHYFIRSIMAACLAEENVVVPYPSVKQIMLNSREDETEAAYGGTFLIGHSGYSGSSMDFFQFIPSNHVMSFFDIARTFVGIDGQKPQIRTRINSIKALYRLMKRSNMTPAQQEDVVRVIVDLENAANDVDKAYARLRTLRVI